MRISLPDQVKEVIDTLEGAGEEAYAVGGCVRDALLAKAPSDWDIATSAPPQKVKSLFRRTADTGIAHGTVTVLLGSAGYEVTTYRIDGTYEDARHPSSVTFTADLAKDLIRRDYTINAMAYNESSGLIDLFGGEADLQAGVIRAVGSPAERFREDALRMLRAVRFAAQLDFTIEEETAYAITAMAPAVGRVSAERIRTELTKILLSGNPMRLLDAYRMGLTAVFLPEFDQMMQTPQNSLHHCYSVGEHTLHAIGGVPDQMTLRAAMLLHDVGKPSCRTTDEAGFDHFAGHPKVGAAMAEEILRRLRFDNETIKRVVRLIRFHDDRPPLTEEGVRRAVSRAGADLYPDLFLVKRADTLAQSSYQRKEKLSAIDEYERLYALILARGDCLCRGDLAVDGRDLLAAGVHGGREVGETLDFLLEHVLSYPKDNQKEILLRLVK